MKRIAFWIASGKKFIDEAVSSSMELNSIMPELERALFTPDPIKPQGFDKVTSLPRRLGKYWYMDRTRYFNIAFEMLEDYDQCLYLDSDTNFIQPFPEIFCILERFDIAAPMGARRITGGTLLNLPDSFAEYELGVIVFRRNKRVQEFFEKWKSLQWAQPDFYGNNSQRSFRDAVWLCEDLRIDRLPSEYGLRWNFGEFMSLSVKILHGRYYEHPLSPTIEDVKQIVNMHDGMRIWSPRDPNWRDGTIPRRHD